jgi:murein DD-endopeptidase MepM/ murein hydrolase activator NlpD
MPRFQVVPALLLTALGAGTVVPASGSGLGASGVAVLGHESLAAAAEGQGFGTAGSFDPYGDQGPTSGRDLEELLIEAGLSYEDLSTGAPGDGDGRYGDPASWEDLSFNDLLAAAQAEAWLDELLLRESWEMVEEGLLDADDVGWLSADETADLGSAPPAGVAAAGEGAVAIPIRGARLVDSFGFPRSGGRTHRGIDIFAPEGTPIGAAAAGVVIQVRGPGARPEGALGGRTVTIAGDDGRFYYYAHNSENLVAEGTVVRAGETIALVGRTGNARTTPPHLHLGISIGGSGFSEARAVNPYPLLVAAQNGEPPPPVVIPPAGVPAGQDPAATTTTAGATTTTSTGTAGGAATTATTGPGQPASGSPASGGATTTTSLPQPPPSQPASTATTSSGTGAGTEPGDPSIDPSPPSSPPPTGR